MRIRNKLANICERRKRVVDNQFCVIGVELRVILRAHRPIYVEEVSGERRRPRKVQSRYWLPASKDRYFRTELFVYSCVRVFSFRRKVLEFVTVSPSRFLVVDYLSVFNFVTAYTIMCVKNKQMTEKNYIIEIKVFRVWQLHRKIIR